MTEREALKLALEALEGLEALLEALLLSMGLTHLIVYGDAEKAITAIKEALAQPAQQEGCQCPACQVLPHASDCAVHNGPAYPKGKCDCGVQQEPEFFAHSVDQPYDWSEWVCPDPKGYLMKCCECGLVHEAEFGVVRYKSETEREDCDMVDDPNLQAVFRMRRSEEWSPKDTAYRPGGLAQPEQEPVAHTLNCVCGAVWDIKADGSEEMVHTPDTTPPSNSLNSIKSSNTLDAQRTWVGLTSEDIEKLAEQVGMLIDKYGLAVDAQNGLEDGVDAFGFARAIEAKLKEKNT